MVRHPQYSPMMPLMTREPNIPVSKPLTIIPTFRPLFSGFENWEAIGMKI